MLMQGLNFAPKVTKKLSEFPLDRNLKNVMQIEPIVCNDVLSLFSTHRESQLASWQRVSSDFEYCDWMKVLAASLRIGFCDEWKRAVKPLVY